MKSVILLLFFFVSQIVNSQSQWRPLGADDFNQPSYGITNVGSQDSRYNKIVVKNANIYSMNVEMKPGNDLNWYVLGKYTNGYWQHIETPFWNNSQYLALAYSFAVDNNEIPYLFLNDPLNGNKATVKKFDGTIWVTVGSGAVSTTSSQIMEMAIGSDNLPFIIYEEGITVQAKKFNGTDWVSISTTSLQGLKSTIVKIDSNNVPYALYSYSSGGNDFSMLKKFNGTSWDEIGITDFSGINRGLCIDSNNLPYILTGMVVRKFNGTSWQTIPNTPSLNFGSLAIDTANSLYLCYAEPFFTDKSIMKLVNGSWQLLAGSFSCPTMSITTEGTTLYEEHISNSYAPVVQKRVGSSWEKCGQGSEMISSGKGNDLSIRNGIPITAFKNNTSKLSVKEFVSDTWSFVGNPTISEQNISNAKIETDSNGTTYVAYTNLISDSSTETQSNITVKKRVGNTWELVGPLNFSLASETYMDFKINHQNVPYVVYKSGRVQKFNGTSWEFVGSSIYTGEKNVQLAFDNNNVPYIFFFNPGLTVVRFNGTGWEEVGTTSLTAFQGVSYPQIVCDSNNTILIGFIGTNKTIHILKWNGTIWEPIGSQVIITESFLNLTVDNNAIPVIMFNKNYNNFRNMANVYKFNVTNWEAIGVYDFSPSEVFTGTILFTETNVPIVIYNNYYEIYSKYYGEQGAALNIGNQQTITNRQLIISPNPVYSTFSLNLNEEIRAIDLFDLTGKKVFSGTEKKDIDISYLKSGLYLIKVKTDTRDYVGKVAKK